MSSSTQPVLSTSCWDRFVACLSGIFWKAEPVAIQIATDIGTEFVENAVTAVASGQSIQSAVISSAAEVPVETAVSLKQRLRSATVSSSSEPVSTLANTNSVKT